MTVLSRTSNIFTRRTHKPPLQSWSCKSCRAFSAAAPLFSGHNRWSKIKHDKGSADAKKNVQRSVFAHEIAQASKLYGANPQLNPRLAAVLATAKKAGFPKASMEAAIARGQGVSATGAALESLNLEAILPPSVAFVIDIETDNRNRTLAELRFIVKNHGGTVTPTNYLFTKRGRVVFENDERGLGVDDVLDEAIEAGAEDVEAEEDGNIIVWTNPTDTTEAANALSKALKLKLQSSDLIWSPNQDTIAPIDSEETFTAINGLVDALQDNQYVQAVYVNVAQGSISDEQWLGLQEKLTI